ncbi:MAG: hypothetical protein JWN34_1915 [Bryobacterales bacterium]|nr:hypothetical protein [Bryobacterales bacterium]
MGVAARFHLGLPNHLPGLRIEGPEAAVVGGRDEDEAASRGDGAAHTHRTRVLDALRFEFLNDTKRHPPNYSPVFTLMATISPHGGS